MGDVLELPPFVVHDPVNWKAAAKHDSYRSKCGRMVDKPPRVEARRVSGYGWHFVCGPHPRYYVRCSECEARDT